MDSLKNIRQQLPEAEGKCKLTNTASPGLCKKYRWMPPPTGNLKLNVDGAFDERTGAAGIGMIIRDHLSQPLLMAWRKLLYCSGAEEAEAMACLEAIRLAERWQEQTLILESDCLAVVEKINAQEPDRPNRAGPAQG